jgi:hypothetical protein
MMLCEFEVGCVVVVYRPPTKEQDPKPKREFPLISEESKNKSVAH